MFYHNQSIEDVFILDLYFNYYNKKYGATLAVASAVAMVGSAKGDTSTKKMMKKTVEKVSDFVDTVSAIM